MKIISRGVKLDAPLALASVTGVALLVLYASPILPPGEKSFFAEYWAVPIALCVALFALLHGLGRIRQVEERRFWQLKAAALVCWLAGDLLYVLKDPPAPPADYLYMGYFIAVIVAIDQKPHLRSGWAGNAPGRLFATAGALIFATGLLCYFALIPSLWDPQTSNLGPHYFYLVMDATIGARFALLYFTCKSPRWRTLYGLLALTGLLYFGADTRDVLYYAGIAPAPSGGLLDLMYFLPIGLLIATCRVRDRTLGQRGDQIDNRMDKARLRYSSVPSMLWIYALLIPMIHVGQSYLTLLDRSFAAERELTVLFFSLTLVTLAIVQQLVADKNNRVVRSQLAVLVMNEQLLQTEKMAALGRLSGGVAHQFNNQLQVVLGHAQMLLERPETDWQQRAQIKKIVEAATRASTLTRQLLAFSSNKVLHPVALDLHAHATEHSDMLRQTLGEDINVGFDFAAECLWIKADPGALSQVISKLAGYARDSMPEGGELTLATRNVELREALTGAQSIIQPGRYVVLSMRDNGPGLNKKTLRHLFEPFSLDPTDADGLALATVYGIVAQSNGHIIVSSDPGEGTTFDIFLPQAQPLPQEAHSPAAERFGGKGRLRTVMLVDDDEALRQMLQTYLVGQGLNVLTAADGVEALQVCDQHDAPLDLLITDVVMPRMGGRDLALNLEKRYPHMHILFMSGHVADSSFRYAAEESRAQFLHKPFALDDLKKIMDALVEGPDTAKHGG